MRVQRTREAKEQVHQELGDGNTGMTCCLAELGVEKWIYEFRIEFINRFEGGYNIKKKRSNQQRRGNCPQFEFHARRRRSRILVSINGEPGLFLFLCLLSGFGDLASRQIFRFHRLDDTHSNSLPHITHGESAKRREVGESLYTHGL